MIDRFDYDRDMGVLHVRFHTGSVFSLRDVPPDVAESFATSPSKGKFWHASLKDRFRAL